MGITIKIHHSFLPRGKQGQEADKRSGFFLLTRGSSLGCCPGICLCLAIAERQPINVLELLPPQKRQCWPCLLGDHSQDVEVGGEVHGILQVAEGTHLPKLKGL